MRVEVKRDKSKSYSSKVSCSADVSALIATCYGRACAPPPVGNGGSIPGGSPSTPNGKTRSSGKATSSKKGGVATSYISAAEVKRMIDKGGLKKAPTPAGSGGSGKAAGPDASKATARLRARALVKSLAGTTEKKIVVQPKELIQLVDSLSGQEDQKDPASLLDLGKLVVKVNGRTVFGPQPGQRIIGRSEMPQIPDEHRANFITYLKEAGISTVDEGVDPLSLKPTQKDLKGPKVGSMLQATRAAGPADGLGTSNPILVTSDGYILDGHHRWAAKAVNAMERDGVTIPVTRINASIDDVLKIGLKFDDIHGIPLAGLADL